jgi:hypothetical protein
MNSGRSPRKIDARVNTMHDIMNKVVKMLQFDIIPLYRVSRAKGDV